MMFVADIFTKITGWANASIGASLAVLMAFAVVAAAKKLVYGSIAGAIGLVLGVALIAALVLSRSQLTALFQQAF